MTKMSQLFLKDFFLKPSKIGSIVPSSGYLADKILCGISWETLYSIVELGAGTGVFTERIAAHKRASCEAVIIEQDLCMRQDLMRRFPQMKFGDNAEQLPRILEAYRLDHADCIISGLPFAMFEKKLRRHILKAILASLKEGGEFIAFQYSPQMYRAFRRIFSEVHLDLEVRNLPPALIYRCKK